jgi:hypothetical protein
VGVKIERRTSYRAIDEFRLKSWKMIASLELRGGREHGITPYKSPSVFTGGWQEQSNA